MEYVVLGTFIGVLMLCLFSHVSILYPLSFGFLLFFCYGILKKHSFTDMCKMSVKGVLTTRKILLVFIFIGGTTAIWRASGTIPMIIYYAAKLIHPSSFFLISFLLNGFLSVLTGTSFGTAATVGVICMSIGMMMNLNPAILGGAILSGAYLGDRSSPMSTSALLISGLTQTDIYSNMKLMIKSALIPFILTSIIYFLLGTTVSGHVPSLELIDQLAQTFHFHWTVLLPATFIILLSLLKIDVKWAMLISIITGCIVSLSVQNIAAADLPYILFYGYKTDHLQLAQVLNGGGIISMVSVAAIVCISSTYSGIFEGTGLLDGLKKHTKYMANRVTSFGSALFTAILTAMVSCNQTLSIMLTHQLCKDTVSTKEEMVIMLEDTVVVIAPLIPWTVASAVPIATISAPRHCLLFAFYLYLIPLCSFIKALKNSRRTRPQIYKKKQGKSF